MIKVKICGLRRDEDIEYANAHLPDYVGFVFAQSKRQVTVPEVKRFSHPLSKGIKKAGIFVNLPWRQVLEAAEACSLQVVQLHGDEPPQDLLQLKKAAPKLEIWKAIRVKDMEALAGMKTYEADAFLLDAYVEGSYGGAGKPFDWNLAIKAREYGRIILAGGLNLENVREAISIVKPFAVDISSGVETDGLKDERKIKDFIYSVRRNMYA